jgi:hypothetical protein
MPRQKAPRVSRTCANPECAATFEVILNAAQSGQRCCSRACARTVDNKARSVRLEAEWLASEKSLCPCGTGRISYAVRFTTKYCSPECRKEYAKRRPRDPSRWATKTCQTCGEDFEIRTSSRSSGKFCSNACAAKHTKRVRHYVCRESDMVLDSTWEMLFAGLCGFDKIPCERYDRTNAIEWTDGHWYAPDFWLPGLETAVEIKGIEDDDDPERWEVWRIVTEQRLLVLGRSDLDQLLMAGSRERWLRGGITSVTKA